MCRAWPKIIKNGKMSLLPFQMSNLSMLYLYLVAYLFSYHEESDQCAIRARLGVASHLCTTPRWGNPAKCLSQRHNK